MKPGLLLCDDAATQRSRMGWIAPDILARRRANDYFYQYGPLSGDAECTPMRDVDKDKTWIFWNGACRDEKGEAVDKDGTPVWDRRANVGYFGKKVLAVSYGGTLRLNGYKGATDLPTDPTDSGVSWMR